MPKPSLIWSFISSFLPILLIILFFLFMMNSLQGGGGRVMQFAKSKAKMVSKDTPKTTFADVAGVDEAIEELGEIKEFLQQPAKFQAVGAKIPKGVLLYGPPGTGKTLLARAVAGEAGVPFYSISGSDFVEMFVGVGASRVRDLFEQAKENAPAIVFIDEIDAVGRHRGAGLGGGHDEREQTLNQLLVEMDGFDVRGGVILIAATNRPDVLDPALLRPGRFDRMVAVAAPNMDGRHKILQVHCARQADRARRRPARGRPPYSRLHRRRPRQRAQRGRPADGPAGQEADRRADARRGDRPRVSMGPQRHSHLMSEQEKLMTAYHEGGHALVAAALPGTDPVTKITILPRGRALGFTQVLPESDKSSVSRNELLNQLAYALGGLAAEQLIFHDPTTGSSNDIEKATKVARAMVTSYGMSDRLGAVKFGEDNGEPFLGRDFGHTRNYSEEIAAIIDEEITRLLTNAHQEAFDILVQNRPRARPARHRAAREGDDRPQGSDRRVRRRDDARGAPGLDGLRLAHPVDDPPGRRARSPQRSPRAAVGDHRVAWDGVGCSRCGAARRASRHASGRPTARAADEQHTGLTWPSGRCPHRTTTGTSLCSTTRERRRRFASC